MSLFLLQNIFCSFSFRFLYDMCFYRTVNTAAYQWLVSIRSFFSHLIFNSTGPAVTAAASEDSELIHVLCLVEESDLFNHHSLEMAAAGSW